MPEIYGHTLIPELIDFAPRPQQVAAFFNGLVKLGAAPLRATLRIGEPGFRTGFNALAGETLTIPARRYTAVGADADLSEALMGLDDYNAQISGEGPPSLPPFALWLHDVQPRTGKRRLESPDDDCRMIPFDSEKTHGFTLECCLRAEVVSTSDRHEVARPGRQIPAFGQPDKSHNRIGIFHHPCTNKIIEVPGAGCARFWIQFEFGKWLFPRIEDSLNLVDPSIVELAKTSLGADFLQGCYWYE